MSNCFLFWTHNAYCICQAFIDKFTFRKRLVPLYDLMRYLQTGFGSSILYLRLLVKTCYCFFKLLTNFLHFLFLSLFIKLCPKHKCFVLWYLFKSHSLKTLTHSLHSKQAAFLPTLVKQYLTVNSSF